MEITKTQKILLGVLSQALTGTEYVLPKDVDWAALFEESKKQAVIPMVFSCISQQCTDREVYNNWKSITIFFLQKNSRIHSQHGILHKILTENGIPYTVIKGSASALDYPDPMMRAMGDVDFLVPESHWNEAKEVLQREGFTSSGENHPFHLAFHKKGFEMEMHREPFGLQGDGVEELLKVVPELVENSVPVSLENIDFRMPDAFGHGIVLLLHAYRHLVDSGIGVRHLCDWAAFISGFSGDEFARIFQTRFEKLGIWKLAQIFSATAHVYLSASYQEWMGEISEEVCRMLMIDILDGGNFGSGDKERRTQNRSIYTKDNKLSDDGKVIQMIRSLNQTAIEDYPKAMNIKILRPFGWIAICFRYVFRVLTGKRKKLPMSTMQMVSMRKKLYQQFNAFDKK